MWGFAHSIRLGSFFEIPFFPHAGERTLQPSMRSWSLWTPSKMPLPATQSTRARKGISSSLTTQLLLPCTLPALVLFFFLFFLSSQVFLLVSCVVFFPLYLRVFQCVCMCSVLCLGLAHRYRAECRRLLARLKVQAQNKAVGVGCMAKQHFPGLPIFCLFVSCLLDSSSDQTFVFRFFMCS